MPRKIGFCRAVTEVAFRPVSRLCPERVDLRVRISPDQIAAHDEHQPLFAGRHGRPRTVLAELARLRPRVHLADVPELFRIERLARRRLGAAHVPELPEVAAALIGQILVPAKLAAHLVIEARHVGLDEALVGQHERDRVGRDLIEPGQQPVLAELAERLVHRPIELSGTP